MDRWKKIQSEMYSDGRRNLVIDLLRGVAAVAVIVAHAIQRGSYPTGMEGVALFGFNFIAEWHMPLFMLLSGVSLYISKKNDIFIKFKRLVIPTFVWSIVLWLVHDLDFVGIKWYRDFDVDFFSFLVTLIKNPAWIIWFLWTIYIISVVIYVAEWCAIKWIKTENKFAVTLLLSVFFFLVITIYETGYLGINYIKEYWPYFLFGYILGALKNNKHFNRIIMVIMGVAIIGCFTHFLSIKDGNLLYDSSITICSICIIYFMIILYVKNVNAKRYRVTYVMAWIGRNSLQLYLCQLICLNIGFGVGVVRIISIFATATLGACLLTVIIKKVPLLNKLLFGTF